MSEFLCGIARKPQFGNEPREFLTFCKARFALCDGCFGTSRPLLPLLPRLVSHDPSYIFIHPLSMHPHVHPPRRWVPGAQWRSSTASASASRGRTPSCRCPRSARAARRARGRDGWCLVVLVAHARARTERRPHAQNSCARTASLQEQKHPQRRFPEASSPRAPRAAFAPRRALPRLRWRASPPGSSPPASRPRRPSRTTGSPAPRNPWRSR